MKLIICSDGVKREIHGSFSICVGRQDLETILHYLKNACGEGFGYGWVNIHSQVAVPGHANEPPSDWYQEAR